MVRDPREDERLADWVDGELAARDLERFEAELRVNPELAAAAEEYRLATERVREALADEGGDELVAPPGMADRVFAGLDSKVVGGSHRFGFAPWVGSAAAAAAIVLVFFVVRAWNEDPLPASTHLARESVASGGGAIAAKNDPSGSASDDGLEDDDLVDAATVDGGPGKELQDEKGKDARGEFEARPRRAEDFQSVEEGRSLEGSVAEPPQPVEAPRVASAENRQDKGRVELGGPPVPGDVAAGAGLPSTGVLDPDAVDPDAVDPEAVESDPAESDAAPTARARAAGDYSGPGDAVPSAEPTESQPVVVFEIPETLSQELHDAIQAQRGTLAERPSAEPTGQSTDDSPQDDDAVRWRALSRELVQVPIDDIVQQRRVAPQLRMAQELPSPRKSVGSRKSTRSEAAREQGAAGKRSSTEYRAQDGDLLFELRGRRAEVEDYLGALSKFARNNRGAVALERAHPEQVREMESLGLADLTGLDDRERIGWFTDAPVARTVDVESLRLRENDARKSAVEDEDRPQSTVDRAGSKAAADTRHRVWIVLRQQRGR